MQEKPNNFGLKYGNQENIKAEWNCHMTKELEGLGECPKAEIHIDLLRTTLKKISNRKTPDFDGIHGFWFKKWTDAYQKHTYLNGWQKERPDWSKKTLKRNRPKQLHTHNVPTYDVENINCTNKRRDLLLANKLRIVLWGTEKMPQMIQRHSRDTLNWLAHPQRKQDETQKSSYGMDWQHKGIWYGPTKLDNKLSQNVQNIRRSHKLYREHHENPESGIDSRREKLNWSEDLKSYIPGRCTLIINIYNCDDATQPNTLEMHSGYKLSKSHTYPNDDQSKDHIDPEWPLKETTHDVLYNRPTHGATESQNWRPIEKCMVFRNFRRKLSQPLLKILRITLWFPPEDNRMCWNLNKWKYVFLLGTLITIKQHKGVIMISGKRYNTNNIESEIFILITGVKSLPYEWIKSLI